MTAHNTRSTPRSINGRPGIHDADRLRHDHRPRHRLRTPAGVPAAIHPSLLGRERIADGIRFRLRADNGVEAWVRGLTGREKACCAFFEFRITNHGDQIYWDVTIIDNETARLILDDFFTLPETTGYGVEII